MAAPVMGGGAPAEDSAPTEDQRDEAEDGDEDFVRGGQEKAPTKINRNSHVRTVVRAGTPIATVTKEKEKYSTPWVVESLGDAVTTSAYNDGKKRCLSVEEGPGNPRKKLYEQNKIFTRAFCKSGRRLSVNEISAEAHKRQKEVRNAVRAAIMTEEELALEELKGLTEKEAARKAATGQAGKAKRATEEARRWAAMGQAYKDKHKEVKAKR
jgi:hypothetical protein